jgi:hypothetical protein
LDRGVGFAQEKEEQVHLWFGERDWWIGAFGCDHGEREVDGWLGECDLKDIAVASLPAYMFRNDRGVVMR